MPPEAILDVTKIDQNRIVATKEQILGVNPHRFEFQQLDGMLVIDRENLVMAAYRDIKPDEFWVRGHIPGRPLFPGVLMIECAAQMVSYFVLTQEDVTGFLGFGGVDEVKFRGQVKPGDRLIMVGKMLEIRARRRCRCRTQGFVNGQMVFEAVITGMIL